MVARRAHNPEVVGSNPAPAPNEKPLNKAICAMLGGFCYIQKQANNSTIIQLDIKNHAFLRNISDKISAFLWSASSIM